MSDISLNSENSNCIYNNILKIKNVNVSILTELYNQNPGYFSPRVILMIEHLGTKKTFNFGHFIIFSNLSKLALFKNIIESSCHDEQRDINVNIMKEYIRAICMYKQWSNNSIINSVLFWLLSKFEQPVSFNMTPSRCKVSIKSTYKPLEVQSITGDVISRCTEQMESLRNSKLQQFTYTSKSCQIENLPNNIINGVVNNLINLQITMNREAQSQNIKIKPFIDIVNDKI